jgi:5-hydroxyisourate hydrolase-like protein (transthyretin family)
MHKGNTAVVHIGNPNSSFQIELHRSNRNLTEILTEVQIQSRGESQLSQLPFPCVKLKHYKVCFGMDSFAREWMYTGSKHDLKEFK